MDSTTGLVYAQQRYYDPVLGRFLSPDPVETNPNTGGSFNRYKYASNNPYRFVDPDGRADVNGFDADPKHADRVMRNATSAFELPNTFTFGMHGNQFITQTERGNQYKIGIMAEKFQVNGMKSGENVFGLSCRFGMTTDAGNNQAQSLANINKSSVYGADGWTNWVKDGDVTTVKVWSGLKGTGTQGAFQKFLPGGDGPVAGAAISSISINTKTGGVSYTYRESVTGSRIKQERTVELKAKK
jgi:RHS repeat-associated protein